MKQQSPRALHRRLLLLGGALLGSLAVLVTAPAQAAGASYTSIFAGTDPRFTGAGWSTCSGPITWDVDTSQVSARQAHAHIGHITWALDQWGQASGLTFTYTGTASLKYDDDAFTLRNGRPSRDRHISLALLPQRSSARLSDTIVGIGSPSAVLASRNEITRGTAVFSAEYLERANRGQARAVVLHELGHVLGLGHTDDTGQVMSAEVHDRTILGAGDIAGIRALTKPCEP